MSAKQFTTIAHAKWILAGEHAVLRGKPALVFPIPSKWVSLHYIADPITLTAEFQGVYGDTLLLFFWGVLENGLKRVAKTRADIQGCFRLDNNIPMGAGLGFSAALCVVVARWFLWQDWITEDELFEFARRLEDNFHGKSSGVDIAGVINNHGMHYTINAAPRPLHCAWQPLLYLSHSAQTGVTAQAINKVQAIWQQDAELGRTLDQQMSASVQLAEHALKIDAATGLTLLTTAMQQAHACFLSWGLVHGDLLQHCDLLLAAGALAVKPTGAGDGGYVLSLWSNPPVNKFEFELISAFAA